MKKAIHYIIISVILSLVMCAPASAMTDDFQRTQVEMEQNAISISISETTLYVKNAEHMVLEVFSITGQKVVTARIDSASKAFELDNLSRGWYIVRIGKFTRKFYIK